MRRLSEWMNDAARGWVAILATAIFAAFMVLVLPRQAAQSEQVSGDAGSPDTSFWYTADELYQIAEEYGADGRAAYIRARWTFDLIYPLVYGFFLVSTVSWLFSYTFPPHSSWRRVNLIALFGVIFDYLENSATSLVMAYYPDPSPVIAALAPYLTLLKWFFVGASFTALFAGCGLALYRFVRIRQDRSTG